MNKTAALLGVVGVLGGLLAGYLLFGQKVFDGTSEHTTEPAPLFYRNPMNPEITSPVPAKDSMGMDYVPVYAEKVESSERKILFYRNPMNPEVTSPTPAKDAMGMDYVPVYADADASGVPGTVKIAPEIQSNIGLRTATATRKSMSRTIRTLGRVDYDEEKLVRPHPKVEGWIKDIRVDTTGQPVERDDILLSIYSPKLVATQQEYLLALSNYEALKDSPFEDIRSGAKSLVASSRERLVLLDVPPHQIDEIEQSRQIKEDLHIHAPAGGTVLKVGVRQGQYVTPASELYLIADLSTVWVYADIYEYELPWVAPGDRIEMTLAGVPGRVFQGELAYIYPYAEARTRTVKVRLVFDNPDQLLRPEMYAEVSIKASEKPDQLVVPSEAVVRSGDYAQIFVVTPDGRFEPRRVVLGVESSGEVAVISGVSAGEQVVVSAQFLIDSESKLREATAKMLAPDAGSAAHDDDDHGSLSSPDHSAMDMQHGVENGMEMSGPGMEAHRHGDSDSMNHESGSENTMDMPSGQHEGAHHD